MKANTALFASRSVVIAVLAGALISFGASNAWAERNRNPGVFPPDAKPYGTTYAAWNAGWLQWALSLPADQSPFLDPDGRYCRVDQSAPVFFLASNFGGTTVRDCAMPAGQSVALNAGGVFCVAPFDGETEDELRACVEGVLPLLTNVSVTVDGVPVQGLEKFLSMTGLVGVTLPADNVLGLPAGQYQMVSGAYLAIHVPLPPGQHVIHLHDEAPTFDLIFDVTYRMTVEPHH